MICLYVQAPFGVFRTFTTGSFRPTAGFITPSAAYGLVLNIAGIESRHEDPKHSMTLTKQGLPRVRMALGALRFPEIQNLYQQLHNYPVGNTGKEHQHSRARYNKYNIVPARREFLSDICAYVCLDENKELENAIRDGLDGAHNDDRYGMMFLGDNNFLIDILREETDRKPAHWYEKISERASDDTPRPRTTRLTISINRRHMADTTSALFSPSYLKQQDIPESAWVTVPN